MRLHYRLGVALLVSATLGLTGCSRERSMATWDADGCGFMLTMVTTGVIHRPWNDVANGPSSVTRVIGMDRPTCVAPAPNAVSPRSKEKTP